MLCVVWVFLVVRFPGWKVLDGPEVKRIAVKGCKTRRACKKAGLGTENLAFTSHARSVGGGRLKLASWVKQ